MQSRSLDLGQAVSNIARRSQRWGNLTSNKTAFHVESRQITLLHATMPPCTRKKSTISWFASFLRFLRFKQIMSIFCVIFKHIICRQILMHFYVFPTSLLEWLTKSYFNYASMLASWLAYHHRKNFSFLWVTCLHKDFTGNSSILKIWT
jgi:hypothetical protein